MIKWALAGAFFLLAANPVIANDGKIIANTSEKERRKGTNGYALPVHGRISINGHAYPFVSGGRGRGAAPFGEYRVGGLSGFTTPRGRFVPGYHLSDAYDPFISDERNGLFIHPGRGASAGCIAILPALWHRFVNDMAAASYSFLELGHALDEPAPKLYYHEQRHHDKLKKLRRHRRRRHR